MKQSRVSQTRKILEKHGLDAMLFTDMKNIRYLTGFTGSDAVLVMTENSTCFLTDSRYVTQAEEQISCEICQYTQKIKGVADYLNDLTAHAKVGFESLNISFDFHADLLRRCSNAISLIPIANASEIRAVKDDDELVLIERSASISRKALENIVDLIRPGVTERDIARALEISALENGSELKAFDFIVATGLRGSMPHGVASDKVIVSGDMVTIDFGSCFEGYFSDETVNFALGNVASELQQIHEIVLEAHDRAISSIKPGIPLREIDRVARDFIADKGYDAFFGHGLGHGVGLDVHEWPRVSPQSDACATTGMVFTVEPGIYKPGLGGVRIEDIVVVTENGSRCLTSLPKELRTLPV